MSGKQRRNKILGATCLLLLLVASFVAARLMAWQHQAWTGLCYMPGTVERWDLPRNQETQPKGLGWTPDGVIIAFEGSPAGTEGLVTGDAVLSINGISTIKHERLAQLDTQLKLNDEIRPD